MCVEKAFAINQRGSESKVITEELEDLQRDMVEIKEVLSLIKRCSVKEVILSEINLISAKIDSLKNLTVVNTDNIMLWSDVVARRRKASFTLQNKPHKIQEINNRYDLLSLNVRCDTETNSSSAVQQTKGRGIYKKALNMKQNKIIILGDNHMRGCAQEVQYNPRHNFEVHGIVKLGANTEIIVNTSTKITGKLTKKDTVVV
jgi:hypothetical protein